VIQDIILAQQIEKARPGISGGPFPVLEWVIYKNEVLCH